MFLNITTASIQHNIRPKNKHKPFRIKAEIFQKNKKGCSNEQPFLLKHNGNQKF